MPNARALIAILAALLPTNGVWAADRGATVYASTCVACHGTDGKGVLPGTPNLRKKDGVMTKSDDELVKSILNGYRSRGSPLAMPAKGGDASLNETDARAVIEYMRRAFAR
jgi:mono/diheme cytochrome c family protein